MSTGEDTGRRLSGVQLAAGVIAVLVMGFLVLLATQEVERDGVNFGVVGQPAPAVRAVSYQGDTFDLDVVVQDNTVASPDQQTWVVLNFFGSWCVGCIEEHDELVRFDQEGARSAVGLECRTELVGVTFDDTEENVIEFFADRGGEWPVLVGEGTNAAVVAYGVTAAPETIVVAPNGLVAAKFAGPVTYEQLTRVIQC